MDGDRLGGSMYTKFHTRQNSIPLTEVRTVVVFVGGKDGEKAQEGLWECRKGSIS